MCDNYIVFHFQARCHLQAATYVGNKVTYPKLVQTIQEACIHMVSKTHFHWIKAELFLFCFQSRKSKVE